MVTVVISCSIPVELSNFLQNNPEVSPSAVLQSGLCKIRDDENKLAERLKGYEIRNGRITAKLDKVLRWIEEQKLTIPQDVLD